MTDKDKLVEEVLKKLHKDLNDAFLPEDIELIIKLAIEAGSKREIERGQKECDACYYGDNLQVRRKLKKERQAGRQEALNDKKKEIENILSKREHDHPWFIAVNKKEWDSLWG